MAGVPAASPSRSTAGTMRHTPCSTRAHCTHAEYCIAAHHSGPERAETARGTAPMLAKSTGGRTATRLLRRRIHRRRGDEGAAGDVALLGRRRDHTCCWGVLRIVRHCRGDPREFLETRARLRRVATDTQSVPARTPTNSGVRRAPGALCAFALTRLLSTVPRAPRMV